MFWLLNSAFFFFNEKVFDLFHVQRRVLVKKRDLHLGPILRSVACAVDFSSFFLSCIWFSLSSFSLLELFFSDF